MHFVKEQVLPLMPISFLGGFGSLWEVEVNAEGTFLGPKACGQFALWALQAVSREAALALPVGNAILRCSQ